jgi:hypothetical protein
LPPADLPPPVFVPPAGRATVFGGFDAPAAPLASWLVFRFEVEIFDFGFETVEPFERLSVVFERVGVVFVRVVFVFVFGFVRVATVSVLR